MLSKEKYIEIFESMEYRRKFDKAILDFYGLDNSTILEDGDITEDNVVLEFFIMVNETFLFKIRVVDNKNMFKESKQFFLNFCNKKSRRKYALVLPCYWEVYYHKCTPDNGKLILDFAYLFNLKKEEEIIEMLEKL